ncbi:beta-N-acetylhexosaminidase [Antribacter gilvus]|uniref:beta-N-acetylhexosaminidase n=1 Tax=Antribacter gilvus TaxID=2304675 RepID=UPI001F0C2BF2|nr:beta-N-acetylhexosaminidase [Antribacter gilvus]
MSSRPGLVPAPTSLAWGDDHVVLPDGARVVTDPALRPAARWWRRVTEEAFGLDLSLDPLPDAASPGPRAHVTFALAQPGALPDGGYRLIVSRAPEDPAHVIGSSSHDRQFELPIMRRTTDHTPERAVVIEAADLAGAHAAAQTLRQLAGPAAFRRAATATHLTLPAVAIEDHPRFTWRGVLLDVARHFLPKADVLRFVDLAAAHRLNVLQLHLTDDQGWRFQSVRHPRLTEVGGWRTQSTVGTWRAGSPDGRPHGGFYTQDDLREVVAYARDRGITVVPEIDVPGHVEAAIAAYPFLGTRKEPRPVRTTWGISEDVLDPSEESLAFFREVLDEVADVFDSPFVALGGDEVPTTRWSADPRVRAHAGALGLTSPDGEPDVAQLHGWFVARLAEHLTSLGRRAVVWDEAFGPQLPRDVVVTSWRGWAQGAAALAAGHDVVMAPEQVTYLDHRAGEHPDEPIPVGFVRTVEDVYAFDPLPPALAVGARMAASDGQEATMRVPTAQGQEREGRLLGAQAQVWTEHLDSARRVDYATFPRLAAFAEAVWSPTADRSPGSATSREFLARLEQHHLPRLDAYGVEYRPLAGPHPWQTRPGVAGYPRDLAAETAQGGWAGLGGWRPEGGAENDAPTSRPAAAVSDGDPAPDPTPAAERR